MLTELSTLKTRLGIADIDTTNDALLTRALEALSARFDRECNRVLARTAGATEEFDPSDRELCPRCYPIESVTKFELKLTEADGWQELQPMPDCLVRGGCVISLARPLPASRGALGRVTYSGGYVLPGAAPAPGQAPLPADLEQAALEQAAYWFQNRDHPGLQRLWEYHGTYRQFETLDLLPSVKATLSQYRRWK